MQLIVNYDQNPNSLPSGLVADVNYVVQYFDSLFTSNVTLTVDLGFGEINGQALQSDALGESEAYYVTEPYGSVKNALVAEGAPGASTLPGSSPLSGTLDMWTGEAKTLGLYANDGSLDGYVGFDANPNVFSYAINSVPPSGQYYFVGVLEHELTEDMGRVSLIGDQPSDYSAIDLFRYSSPGHRDLAGGGSGSTAYFSVDGGNTNLGTWNNNPNNGDFADWYPSGPASGGYDAFNDYSNSGVINVMSQQDIVLMQALGWATTVTTFAGANIGTISASLATAGDVENNSTSDLVWYPANTQLTVWALNTSGNVTSTNLGPIGSGWTILNSGNYLTSGTTQMLTDYAPNGTMTLWWVNNNVLAGIDLGLDLVGNTYVASGNFTTMGSDDILVKNQATNDMYVWWVNQSNNTLAGINIGAVWNNRTLVASGNFLSNGSDDMLIKNNPDNGMYLWWITSNNTLDGINLGDNWANTSLVASGNFLANGSDDMLLKNNVTNAMSVSWVNTSNDTLASINLGNVWSPNIQFLTSGHFAGTGDEMLVRNTTDDHMYMWWVNPQNTLSGVDLGALSPQWQVVATNDFDNDGFTDIAWQNTLTGQVDLWKMGNYSLPSNGSGALGANSGGDPNVPGASPGTDSIDTTLNRFLQALSPGAGNGPDQAFIGGGSGSGVWQGAGIGDTPALTGGGQHSVSPAPGMT